MEFFRYLALLINRAAANSITLTDRITILLVPFATLAFWLTGVKMTQSIQETLALGVAITVMVVVMLRLTAASYFLWKEDKSEISDLKRALDSARFKEFEAMNDHRLGLRKELGDRIAWLITYAEARAHVEGTNVLYDNAERLFAENFTRAKEIVSQLSYDVHLRVTSLNLINLAAKIAEDGKIDVDEHGKYPLLDRLWQQRKLTFKLLHRQDIHEIITVAEIENVIGEFGEGFSSGLEELKELLKKNPELSRDKRLIALLNKD